MRKSNTFSFRVEYHYVPSLVDNLLLFLVMFIFGYNDILLFFFPFEGRGLKKTKRKQTSRSFTQSILFYSKYILRTLCLTMRSWVHPFKALLTSSWISGNFNCSFCNMEKWKFTFFSPTSLEGNHVQCNFTMKFRLRYSGLTSSTSTNL